VRKLKPYLPFLIPAVLVLQLLFFSSADIFAQGDPETSETVDHDSKREEVQRYIGYETLLYRYLTLPFDTSLNVNEHGSFVEIGFLYILFIPVLLMFLARNKRLRYFLATILGTLILWIISASNSFLFSTSRSKINSSHESLDAYLRDIEFSAEPLAHLVAYLYKAALFLYAPFDQLGEAISGNKDGVTYPILFIAFILGSLIIEKIIRELSSPQRFVVILFWVYGFYWLAFAGGIIWYGYILLILGLFFILLLFDNLSEKETPVSKYLNYSFIALASIWICLAFVNRVSNIQAVSNTAELGKGIFNTVFYEYGLGKINKTQSIDKVYPNASQGLKRINAFPNSTIWRVGTSFTYFIDNNTERVFMDNQLGLFYELYKKYPNNVELAEVFKASGVQFVIIDLNTAQIDKTPNKTLTDKYIKLMQFVANNPKLRMLATDRVLKRMNNSNKLEYFYGMFGDIQQNGRYAIFEII